MIVFGLASIFRRRMTRSRVKHSLSSSYPITTPQANRDQSKILAAEGPNLGLIQGLLSGT